MMIQQITQRLSEVNTLVATCNQDGFSFGRTLSLSLFYRDFNDTNSLVKEAENLARENPARLLECSISLLSETDGYLSSDRSELYAANFYSAKSNRLDLLPLESAEYRLLDKECDTAKAEYDRAHALADLLYQEWQQELERCFCVYCFKPLFLDVLVERLKGIAGSIIADINRMQEGKP